MSTPGRVASRYDGDGDVEPSVRKRSDVECAVVGIDDRGDDRQAQPEAVTGGLSALLQINGDRVDALSEKYGAAVKACETLLPAGTRLPHAPAAPAAPPLP